MTVEGVTLDTEVRVDESARAEVEYELAHMGWVMTHIGNEDHSVGWAELRGGFAALAWTLGLWPYSVAPDHQEEPEQEQRFQMVVAAWGAKHEPDEDDDNNE